ncbi:sigma-54 interaction domain-containing protein [Candidatus Moduliflexus flocculans]|uniref:Sigma-54 interaction domain-containing protein n=1 Tax=Candidatus Moduliflexus flocculans TaxID=1499966 RepID=A0A081BQR2_9BACT|nr:sigma-54 interaction domain-containing protein [Candidatus Moduliflexus flocculans]
MTLSEDISQRGTILVVDDSKDSVRLLTTLLHQHGYTVRFALDGLSALKFAQSSPPELILFDIMLPDISGYEVCERLQAHDATRHIPIIFLSALIEPLDKVKAFRIGGSDYLTKPYHEAEALARVKLHVNIARLQKQLRQQIQRYETLEQAVFEGIILVENGDICDVNHSFCEMLGVEASNLFGRRVVELVAPLYQEQFLLWLESTTKESIEIRFSRADGTCLITEIRGKSLEHFGQQAEVIAIRDMTVNKELEQENRAMRLSLGDRVKFGELVGKSARMQTVYERVLRAANSEYPVLILGETGTGKELVAREIHRMSQREQHPFLAVNCGALPESLFESLMFGYKKGAFTGADRDQDGFFDRVGCGTLFLDEVGELTPEQQVKLLRVLQDGEYTPIGGTRRKANARIMAATNRDLDQLRHEKKFRDDFFYRINILSITLPPLRERKEDLPLLIGHIFEQEGCSDLLLPSNVRYALIAYDWPGNVRELQAELKQYLVSRELSPRILIAPAGTRRSAEALHLPDAVFALERQLISAALEQTGGERSRAAQLLGIDRKTLYRKLKEYEFE